MRIIGITGGIGTGKSTILHLLGDKYQAYIVETDKLAHQLMMPGKQAYEKIVKHFGVDVLFEDGSIDRGKLGRLVFQNETELAALNAIVHPAVKQYILEDIEEKKKAGTVNFYVIEAALLIEDGYKAICDEIWYIYVEKEERIRRLIAGRGGNREKWESVINNQSSEEFYRENCNQIVENGGDIQKTAERIHHLLFGNNMA
ncbi:MAG: dephospho-CoA kinase [Clostridiales bacterium]|nr:dephospho-CoA kinase [Clostridiales bacterium]